MEFANWNVAVSFFLLVDSRDKYNSKSTDIKTKQTMDRIASTPISIKQTQSYEFFMHLLHTDRSLKQS